MDEPLGTGLSPEQIKKLDEGDETKNKYLDKAIHANEEALSGSKLTDLLNKNSSVYKDQNIREPKPQAEIPAKPTVDAEGYPIIEQVHTYREDLTGIVNQDNLSLSRIAMMQGNARRTAEESEPKPKEKDIQSKIFLIVGVTLVLVSVGIIGGVIMIMNQKKAEEAAQIAPPKERYLIFSEKKEDFDVTKSTKTEISARLNDLKDGFKEEDSIMEIVPEIDTDSGTRRATMSEFFDKVGSRVPDELSRTLADKFFFGLYSKKGRTDPFIVFYTSSYDIAYPSMLDWEGFMRDDYDWIYLTKPKPTTGTTTPILTFKDRIVANKDARSFEDEKSRTAFFYSFIDDHTILFANTSDTIRKVMDRIREAKFQ